jgi:hypothetical protein
VYEAKERLGMISWWHFHVGYPAYRNENGKFILVDKKSKAIKCN